MNPGDGCVLYRDRDGRLLVGHRLPCSQAGQITDPITGEVVR